MQITIPELSLKAITPIRNAKKKKKKSADQILQLGSDERVKKLPDEVSELFVSEYRNSLDDLLYPYVATHMYTLSQANAYADMLVSTIFGDENHLGLFQFVKDKSVDNLSDKEMVIYCERLIIKGWSIKLHNGTYWIYNGDLQRITNVTGKNSLSNEGLTFNPSNAHLFLPEEVGARIQTLAMGMGYEADALVEIGSLDMVLRSADGDLKTAGYILNYNKLRDILLKRSKYPTLSDGLTITKLYMEGFRLAARLINGGAVIQKDKQVFVLYPIQDELGVTLNKDMASVVGSRIKDKLMPRKVVNQSLQEVKDLKQAYAILTEYFDLEPMSYKDSIDRMRRITNEGTRPKASLYESIASVIVTDAILLGNNMFNLGCVGIDSVSGRVFSYASREYFSTSQEALEEFIRNAQDVEALTRFDAFLDNFYAFRLISLAARQNLVGVIKLLPTEYFENLKRVEFPGDDYKMEFEAPMKYFDTAREFILSYEGK